MVAIWVLIGASALGWFLSTLAGGGSPLVLIPAASALLGPTAVPPTITVGMLCGNAQRIWFYRQHVDRPVTVWFLPGAIGGAVLGAFAFSRLQVTWLGVLLGLFLLVSVFTYNLSQHFEALRVRAWYFLPAGFVYAFLSGLIGSTGPLLNSFYLNYGLDKEGLVGTKSANVAVVHVVKILAYLAFGALTQEHLVYGLAIGVGALPGNWLGQRVLERMEERHFRQFVLGFVALSALLLLWDQRQLVGF